MNRKARRVLPRDAPPYFTLHLDKFSGLPIGYYTLVAYVLPLAHTRACGSVLSHSIGGDHARRVTLPVQRPARRLGARRYVKDRRFMLGLTTPSRKHENDSRIRRPAQVAAVKFENNGSNSVNCEQRVLVRFQSGHEPDTCCQSAVGAHPCAADLCRWLWKADVHTAINSPAYCFSEASHTVSGATSMSFGQQSVPCSART